MSRWIDADKLIVDMQERYCKPCKEKGEDYNEVRCRACWVDDAIGDVDGFGDNSIDIVRCKECKNSIASVDNSLCCRCWYDSLGFWEEVKADDFCSYGERRE